MMEDRLATLLKAAGRAHHAAYAATDGADPEWPIWYTDHIIDEARGVLEVPGLTKSQLIAALVDADLAYQEQHPDQPWWVFYADVFALRLGRRS
jgi:hypothetical protein